MHMFKPRPLFFEELSAAEKTALAPHMRAREYPRGHRLFTADEMARHLHIVSGGRIKLFTSDAAGRQQVVRVSSSGDVLGLLPLFEDPPLYLLNAEVLVKANVMEISMPVAKQLLKTGPSFSGMIVNALRNEVRINLEMRHVLALPATKRVAWLLLNLTRRMLGTGGSFRFPYDKGVAAAELCMSAETFSRSLAQLKIAGVTCRDSEIAIEAFDRLRGFMNAAQPGRVLRCAEEEPGTGTRAQIEFDLSAGRPDRPKRGAA
jgi:CRP-like cAMP-binding protein